MQHTTTFADNLIAELKLTQVEQQQLAAIDTKENICKLLNWNEEQYHEFQHGTAINFLHFKCNGCDGLIPKLERSKLFWAWFKNMWANEEAVIVIHLQGVHQHMRYTHYLFFWDAFQLSQQHLFPRCVWADILNKKNK